jgi:uncharacterized protein (DUF1786 family)
MQILTADIGTGTQDILLFDTERAPENCLKLVMPSPTLALAERIKRATAEGRPLLITGTLMGGGPVVWAVEAHRRAGLQVLATAEAARTFNDDLERVRLELGVSIVPDDVAHRLIGSWQPYPGYAHILFHDFYYPAIRGVFTAFGVDLRLDALALAVFDHGAAPPEVSDRQFRMDYLAERLRQDRRLSSFAFRGDQVPEIMTRLRALADIALRQTGLPVVVMDSAPAAVLGALEDPQVARHPDPLVVNVGNFHTLAFQFRDGQIARLFEHHTGELTPVKLAAWLGALADGNISHETIFQDHGHGAVIFDHQRISPNVIAVVGPRRVMLNSLAPSLNMYLAVPHGDQMLAGCFGLLRACADLEPAWCEPIETALAGKADQSLW